MLWMDRERKGGYLSNVLFSIKQIEGGAGPGAQEGKWEERRRDEREGDLLGLGMGSGERMIVTESKKAQCLDLIQYFKLSMMLDIGPGYNLSGV